MMSEQSTLRNSFSIPVGNRTRDSCQLSPPTPEELNPVVPIRQLDDREHRLFRSLDVENTGHVVVRDLMDALKGAGFPSEDQRLEETTAALRAFGLREKLSPDQFCQMVRPNILLIERILQGNLIVPDFGDFSTALTDIFTRTAGIKEGDVADYIPQLARANPEHYAAACCTIDGQRWEAGDASVDFCIQSCCKPINYCFALEEAGAQRVHTYVGREPSGRIFNELALNDEGKPHNPMINAGAIMCSSLLRQDLDSGDRFEFLRQRWQALCGNETVGFNNAVYQSERQTADRNFALGYYMREKNAFPPGTDLMETLEFYFQCCSIEINAKTMAVMAATLANGGVCPTTGERIFRTETVQHCLSLMSSCGMYDYSGEFAFTIGLPAKSGVSGALFIVVPNVMGMCIWSPPLDSRGNSVRGIAFCEGVVDTFNVRNYDSLTGGGTGKIDPRVNRAQTEANKVDALIWAANKGDQGAVHRLVVRGFDQDAADYDGRTALHLACSEGREEVVRYLAENGAALSPKDRWVRTPLDDAYRNGDEAIIDFLESSRAERGMGQAVPIISGATIAADNVAPVESNATIEMIYAASAGDLAAIQRLVARGVKLHCTDYDWRTPLHLAAAEGHEHVVQYFIDHGVPLNPRDRWGATPLDDAKRHNHGRVVHLLNSCRGT